MSYPPARGASRTHEKAIASLVLGICAVFVPIPLILGIFAIVLGNAARREIREDPLLEGDGMATAGIVLGWVDVVLSLLGIVILILFFGVFGVMAMS